MIARSGEPVGIESRAGCGSFSGEAFTIVRSFAFFGRRRCICASQYSGKTKDRRQGDRFERCRPKVLHSITAFLESVAPQERDSRVAALVPKILINWESPLLCQLRSTPFLSVLRLRSAIRKFQVKGQLSMLDYCGSIRRKTLKKRAGFKRMALTVSLLIGLQNAYWANAATTDTFHLPETIDLAGQSDYKLADISPDDEKLLKMLKAEQYDAAKDIVSTNLKQAKNDNDKVQNLELLAFIAMQQNHDKDALSLLQKLPLPADTQGKASARMRARNFRRMGDLNLQLRKTAKAIDCYKLAIAACQNLDANDSVRVNILDPLIGSLLGQKQYAEAQPYAEQLVSICETRAAAGHLLDAGSLFWAYIQLMQVYKEIHPELHESIQPKFLKVFDTLLTLRRRSIGQSFEKEDEFIRTLQTALLNSYLSENEPKSLSDYVWLSSEFRMRYLPLIDWQAATPPKAVILCIHGLGLENRAFSAFGTKMSSKGYAIYALDVRGFGAWQSEYGDKSVSFDRALSDISAVIKILKQQYPGLPVFLLGESMGGGIVLRAASEYGDEMAGIISSVPSAERYGSRRMTAQATLHFLRGPNEPYDVGSAVEKQATSKAELRELWRNDPKAKGLLTPVELLKFDTFMKETKKRCKRIRSTPVMMVQGMEDKLVKPKGTYEMYDNVESPDKTMIILGSAEHLIFETLKQNQVLLDGLAAWIDNHLGTKENK